MIFPDMYLIYNSYTCCDSWTEQETMERVEALTKSVLEAVNGAIRERENSEHMKRLLLTLHPDWALPAKRFVEMFPPLAEPIQVFRRTYDFL